MAGALQNALRFGDCVALACVALLGADLLVGCDLLGGDVATAANGGFDGGRLGDAARPDQAAEMPAPRAVAAPSMQAGDAKPTGQPVDPQTLELAPFVDVTAQFGFDAKKWHEYCLTVADFDNDGREDFTVVEFGTLSKIHTVLVQAGGAKHVYSALDVSLTKASFACSAADIDGDGSTDLVLGTMAGPAIYRGDGKGSFTDISATRLPGVMDYAAFSVAPADLDGDGDLDLYVGAGFEAPPCAGLKCGYSDTDLLCEFDPPIPSTPKMDDHVLIQGADGSFTDATAAWNVPPGGNQTVVMPFDVDEDGKVDMLVGDEAATHRLLHNTGSKFVAHDTDIGFNPWAAAMGWSAGDLNGDGKPDLVLADAGPSPVYLQQPAAPSLPARFADAGGKLGVWWPSWSASAWAPLIADLDHDGRDDLLLGVSVNMSVLELMNFVAGCGMSLGAQASNPFVGLPSIDLLYTHGEGPGLRARRMPTGKHAHGLMVDQRLVDLDGDGDLDVVQTRPGPTIMPVALVRLLRNDLAPPDSSVLVRLQGKGKNRDALGAHVTAKVGGKVQRRWLFGSAGFGGTPSRFAYFGLGGAAQATDVRVRWPDGQETLVGDVAPGKPALAVWP